MVPTDYRLEQVCTRLIERLEGARRTYVGFPERAVIAFNRIAAEQVEAAIREYREVALADHPEDQATLLRREVLATFLPRYTRLAVQMTAREEAGFGMGVFAEPMGRAVLAAIAVFFLFFCWRLVRVPLLWPMLLAILVLPFASDLVRWMYQGWYGRRLEAVLGDMARIQEQAGTYLTPSELAPERGGKVLHLVPPSDDGEDDEGETDD
ncbi:MAG: hypothetical protein JRJ84_02780 [Deltaproteobacteria bacterium]|nr:hypothetical protein [Deltaproteobacteria bacterium]